MHALRMPAASVDARPGNNVKIDFQLLAATTVFRRLEGGRMVGYVVAMSEPNAIEAASRRLALALDALAAQLHALGNDRSRLASELDDATARARSLENVSRDVTRRLDAAMARLRSLLAAVER